MSPERSATPLDAGRRLVWFLLLRAALTTLLLGVAVVADATAAAEHDPTWRTLFFALIVITFGLTLLWALLIRRGVAPNVLARWLIGCDTVLVTMLVLADGGAESGFVALYVVLLAGAALTLSRRGALIAGAGILALYAAMALAGRFGVIPSWPDDVANLPLRAFVLGVGKNLVLFAAAFALARRLAGEVEEAGQKIADQGARLDELAALHTDVVRSMTSGLLTMTDEGRVLSLNPAGEEILGLFRGELVARSIADRLPEIARVALGDVATAGPPRRAEVEIVRPDGERRIVGLSVALVVSEGGTRVGRMVNFQDLTDLRRMQERIERSERLAAIGRLAAGVAHEIRNPLAAISGSIELLTPSVSNDPDSRDLMAILTREVDRLNRLITDLLDFARPRPPAVAPLQVGGTLREILRVVENDRRLNPVANRFSLTFEDGVWVDADPGQLRQVVLNLLLNAADATPSGEPIELRAFSARDQAIIEVRDHGPGIPAAVRARIFEPFYTTKKTGTGLGLATVHRIVEEHHGTIEIAQPEGGGTIFRVILPLRPPLAPEAAIEASAS